MRSTGDGRNLVDNAKPFCIPKRWVWKAYKRVKANRGAAGVDEQSVEQFEEHLKGNLYKLWNRLSSGSYFPPPVKRVDIAKRDGGTRPLGIPTVADRIAQAVVKAYSMEPALEQHFHPDAYGYRPKSALDAVGVARKRCWRSAWVLDLDIRAYFDTIPHGLLLKAVRAHTDCAWVLLYDRAVADGSAKPDGRPPSWQLGRRGRRKGQWFQHCSRISSCTTRLIGGWHNTIQTVSSSNASPMTSSATV